MDCLYNLRSQASCAAIAVAAAAAVFGLAAPNVATAATQSAVLAQASAASSAAPKSAPSVKGNAGSRSDRVEARIKDLHAKLHISANQEDKWNAVAQVMRENGQTLDSLTQTRVKNAAIMTAVDDVNSYSQIAEAHAAGVKKFVPVFQALYDSMSDAQKKQADQIFRGRARTAAKAAAK